MTRILAYTREAAEAIRRNRVRSILTMLGMIIGTASIIGVLGMSRAASGGITATLTSFGDPGSIVATDDNQNDPDSARIQYRDVASLEAATKDLVQRIVPDYEATYELRANGIKYSTTVASQEGSPSDSLTLYAGRRIDDRDVADGARVTLLSESLYHRFFGNKDAIGSTMRIGGSRFRIIGIYDAFKANLLNTIAGSDYIEIPYSAFHELKPGNVDFIQVYAQHGVSQADASAAVVEELQHLHGSRAEYVTQDASGQLAGFNSVLAIIAAGLTAIGGVALVVAGIGIMNIMLVSVAERTREIGLRKAVGASRGDVFLQFLLEAILLSLIGGGIGTALGLGATLLAYGAISKFVGPAPVPYLLIVSIAVGFSTVVGTVFGSWPALRAGRLDPIEALRS